MLVKEARDNENSAQWFTGLTLTNYLKEGTLRLYNLYDDHLLYSNVLMLTFRVPLTSHAGEER